MHGLRKGETAMSDVGLMRVWFCRIVVVGGMLLFPFALALGTNGWSWDSIRQGAIALGIVVAVVGIVEIACCIGLSVWDGSR